MSAKKGVLKGPKFNGRHTTYIDAAEPLIVAARDLACVTKVTIGPIENTHAHGSHFRIRPQPSGALKLLVSGGGASQTLFVFTTDAATTEAELHRAWDSIR
jgi:hypothetical protein